MQRQIKRYYQGVDGDNWYLNDGSFEELDNFYEENIEKAWEDNDYVDVCNNLEYLKKYIDISQKENIMYKSILCVTEKIFPQMTLLLDANIKFLGYDYAYPGGSYYSAILNDVIPKRIPEFIDIKLNSCGLFDTYEAVMEFVNLRKRLQGKKTVVTEYLEEGDFVIYKLYEIVF